MNEEQMHALVDSVAAHAAKVLGHPEAKPTLFALVDWALFKERPIEECMAHLEKLKVFGADPVWACISALLVLGLFRLKPAVPILFDDALFVHCKPAMSSLMYAAEPNLTTIYPNLRATELPILDDSGAVSLPVSAPAGAPRRKLRTAVWTYKLGNYMSSMTAVHPWLMNLANEDLEVFVLSERRGPQDDVQTRYRQLFGPNFTDCDDFTDEEFVRFVRSLELDVFLPLHITRPALKRRRLARVHLDVLADLNLVGMPDRTLISEGMIDDGYMKGTDRGFIVIPDPPHVYAKLPMIELQDGNPAEPFCFGVFNRLLKIHDGVFDTWAKLLHACPNSAILFTSMDTNTLSGFVMQYELTRRGIPQSRVVLAPRVKHAAHLARHNVADLMIDTFPLGGGMTAVDAFHMGVPLVSLTADRRPAVQQTKVLINLLGPEAGVAAQTEEEYLDYAKACYAAGKRTKAQREKLRSLALNSLLFDYQRYTQMIRTSIAVAAGTPSEQMIYISADYKVHASELGC